MKLMCHCKTKKGVEIPSLSCKNGVSVQVGVIEDSGHFVWYYKTIMAFKIKKYINLDVPLSDEDLKILSNPNTSNLLIKLQHHLLGSIFYRDDKIFAPWSKSSYDQNEPPSPYNAKGFFGSYAYTFVTPFRRRGKNAMPLPTKWAVFGYIDRALTGSSNT